MFGVNFFCGITPLFIRFFESLKYSLSLIGLFWLRKYSVSKNVNPYLIGAIIIVNTGCNYECNAITTSCNNVGGIHGNGNGCFGGTYRKYDNLEAGIRDLVDYIANNFYSKDLKSPLNIYSGYGKDSAWGYRVYRYMEKLKK